MNLSYDNCTLELGYFQGILDPLVLQEFPDQVDLLVVKDLQAMLDLQDRMDNQDLQVLWDLQVSQGQLAKLDFRGL